MPVFCQRGFACGETARAVIGPAFWVCRAKSGAAFRCAKPPCAVVRFAAMTSSPRTDVLACPAFALLSHSPTALLNTPALVAVRLHFACAKPRWSVVAPAGGNVLATPFSLPHFRFAQMWPRIFPRGLPGYVPLFHGWPRARTPALVGLRLRFACGETARAVIGPTGADVLAYPAFASLKRGPAANNPALVAIRLHFAVRNRAGRSLSPPGATCSLPHFRFAQMWPRARTPALIAIRLHFAARNRAGRSLPPPGATCSLPHFRFAQMWPRIFPRGLPGYVPLFHGWPRARTPAQAAAAASAPAVFAAAETVSSATRAAAAPRRMARMKCPARRQAMYISPPRLFSFVFSFSFFLLF